MSRILENSITFLQVFPEEVKSLGRPVVIQSGVFSEYVMRFAIHLDVEDEMTPYLVKKIAYVIKEFIANKS